MLIAKELVECFELIELQHAVIIQISGHEDVVDILQLFSLKLVSCVDHKLSKVIKLDGFVVRVQV